MGVLGCPKGSASELLDGTLKLRHCATLFTMHFPHGLYQVLEMGVVKGSLLLLVINAGKRVRLTRKTRPGVSSHSIPNLGHPTPSRGDGEDCAPLPPKEKGWRWACLAIFFLDLGLGDCLLWGRLEPAFGGKQT